MRDYTQSLMEGSGYFFLQSFNGLTFVREGPKVTALIASAGLGKRMGIKGKKQYLLLGRIPIIAHTLSVFDAYKGIESIVLIVPEGDVEYCKEEVVRRFGFKKVRKIIAGGKERQDSVRKGLEVIDGPEYVIVHDGVRPFVNRDMIDRVIRAVVEYGAVTVGIPVRDTIKRVSKGHLVEWTIEREGLWLIQTPQAFRTDLIIEAHKRAFKEGVSFTDDCRLVEWMGMPVVVVEGSIKNIKITTKEDLKLAEAILNAQ